MLTVMNMIVRNVRVILDKFNLITMCTRGDYAQKRVIGLHNVWIILRTIR